MSYRNPIMSDDPQAVEKLKAELAKLEKGHQMMKEANAILKKQGASENASILLRQLGYSDKAIHNMMNPMYSFERMGHQQWELNNNSANMRRIKERIAKLEPA